MSKEKKEKVKEKIGKGSYLSAQEYKLMTGEEKKLLREVLVEDEQDPDDYERKMQTLWPKKFEPKPLTWRRR